MFLEQSAAELELGTLVTCKRERTDFWSRLRTTNHPHDYSIGIIDWLNSECSMQSGVGLDYANLLRSRQKHLLLCVAHKWLSPERERGKKKRMK